MTVVMWSVGVAIAGALVFCCGAVVGWIARSALLCGRDDGEL